MIPKECKRLAEVDFPIAEVSKHAAREKSIRHGHPSTLHLWWARRPLASCRAVLLELLLPDPCDPLCPPEFKQKAHELLVRPLAAWKAPGTTDEGLRASLLSFVGAFANWDVAANPVFLEVGRGLVKAAHPEEAPLVVDPFAGGGSIPLEALRLGCEAFASDLNPVACLILKVMLEDIPRNGPELADELRETGAKIKEQAEHELADLYPINPDGSRPIAYLWARTVRCEAPNCGAEIPLMRSFWLCKKSNRKRALRPVIAWNPGYTPHVEFEVFEPKTEKEVSSGTVSRARATCQCCGVVLQPERVREQLSAQRGGADVIFDKGGNRTGGARLLAVVALNPGVQGRQYRLPTESDYAAVFTAQKRVKDILNGWERAGRPGLRPVPDEPTPKGGGSGASRAFSVQKYGMFQWGDLFTGRQKVALITIARITQTMIRDESGHVAMAIAIGRASDQLSSLVRWLSTIEAVGSTFGRPALPMVWDMCEIVPTGNQAANFGAAVEWIAKVVELLPRSEGGQIQLADAISHPLPDGTARVWFTDPPYYDAVPYSDLSDFFLVWLKRTIPSNTLMYDPFDPTNPLSPKTREAVQDETKKDNGHMKGRAWFEETMAKAFAEGRRVLNPDGIGSVVFAHKTTEGWEALLSGMIRGGWTITGSWPIATERQVRPRAHDSAALATSVHLVCRPRPEDAPVGDWGDVLRELPGRVGDWMERLQGEGIRGADLVFACIGPALEIFSRYSKVETAEGREVPLAEYLEKVWEAVGRSALAQVLGTAEAKARNGAAGAVEEDARLTALFLWTLQSTNGTAPSIEGTEDAEGEEGDDEDTPTIAKAKGFSLVFDVVRRFAQPLGIDLPKWEGRIIEIDKGVVRLLPVAERARQLFGEDGAAKAAELLNRDPATDLQLNLFAEVKPKAKELPAARRKRKGVIRAGEDEHTADYKLTTLDHVHAAMILQASGQTTALRSLLAQEQARGPDFLRLANALSALYPTGSEEKRLLDAMLLAVPR